LTKEERIAILDEEWSFDHAQSVWEDLQRIEVGEIFKERIPWVERLAATMNTSGVTAGVLRVAYEKCGKAFLREVNRLRGIPPGENHAECWLMPLHDRLPLSSACGSSLVLQAAEKIDELTKTADDEAKASYYTLIGHNGGIDAAARAIEDHCCVSTCCDAQPGASTAKELARCIRKLTVEV